MVLSSGLWESVRRRKGRLGVQVELEDAVEGVFGAVGKQYRLFAAVRAGEPGLRDGTGRVGSADMGVVVSVVDIEVWQLVIGR